MAFVEIPIVNIDPGIGGGTGGGAWGGGTSGTTVSTVIPEVGTLQILLSEGRIEGLLDGLKSVFLDRTPILASDGTTFNYKGIALALVAGTNTQPAISGITGTESETNVGVQVKHGTPVTRTINSNPTAVRVRIAIPALKTVNSTTGAETANSVTYTIERQCAAYTPSGLSAGDWEVVTLSDGGVVSEGPYSSKLTKSYHIDLPASGAWQIRITRVSADDADSYHYSTTWFDAYTEIIDGAFRYPNSAVLSVALNATQFRSIPQVTALVKGIRIKVPSNYTPAFWTPPSGGTPGFWTAAVYTGMWDGTFQEVWSSNPAWVWYDVATRPLYGCGAFLDAASIDKWALYSIAQWCDDMISGEPRMSCNLYLQGAQNAIKALGQLASIFNGITYYASGLVVPVADRDASPVALFTNANVEGGKFTYEGTARSARHTAAIVKFINPELGYATDSAVYEDEAGIARYGYNALDLQGIACTSYAQALRLGKQAILSELLAPETVSFTSGLEGSTAMPGDIIQVSDQFRAGQTRFGGRCAGGSSTTVINLDAPVTIGSGTHTLRVQTATGMESKTVTTGAGTVQQITVSPALSSAPVEAAGWLLQSPSLASLWRVLSVAKADGLKYSIVALKHDPAKYA